MLATIDEATANGLLYDWPFWSRPDQRAPAGDWSKWLILAGRGWGKTRTGGEFVRAGIESGTMTRVALVAPTAADARDVMVEGESGLMSICPPWNRPTYEPSKRRVVWDSGAMATLYSADEPDRLRGPQHDCFVAGTLIRTSYGDVPIERVSAGERVLTRVGFRRVTATRNVLRVVGRVAFSNGAVLVGTAQHRILTPRGWTKLADLKCGDTVCAGDRLPMATSPRTSRAKRSTSTVGYGNNTTDPFQAAIRSITETRTRRITTSPILSWSPSASIEPSTWQPLSLSRCLAPNVDEISVGWYVASDRPFARHASIDALRSDGAAPADAATAEQNSSPAWDGSVASVVSTWERVGERTAHDLTVDDLPEFVANGIIVHNSAWGDEIAAWRYPEAYDQLMFGLRLGVRPRAVFTTTPRPVALVRGLLKDPTCVVTRGSTYANRANLADTFFSQIVAKYEGTRIGRQELYAEVLDDVEGALWTRTMIEAAFVAQIPIGVTLIRVVIAIDPAVTSTAQSDETGIIAVGMGSDGIAYVLRDVSKQYTPDAWARTAVTLYHELDADLIVAEVNNGGDLVTQTIRTVEKSVPIRAVRASRGKHVRAEPIAALYEQRKIRHVGGFAKLEDQLCAFTTDGYAGGDSPDRADALVWALTELVLNARDRKPLPPSVSYGSTR